MSKIKLRRRTDEEFEAYKQGFKAGYRAGQVHISSIFDQMQIVLDDCLPEGTIEIRSSKGAVRIINLACPMEV